VGQKLDSFTKLVITEYGDIPYMKFLSSLFVLRLLFGMLLYLNILMFEYL